MILLLIISLFLVAAIMLFSKSLSLKVRTTVSDLVFILVNLPTAIFIVVGDKPSPGARVVTQQEIGDAARNGGN